MYNKWTASIVLVAAVFGTGHAELAQATVVGGHVVRADGGAPLPGVLIRLSLNGGPTRLATSNGQGLFKFDVPPGTYHLQAQRTDLQPYSSQPAVVVVGGPQPLTLAPLRLHRLAAAPVTVLLLRHADRQGSDDSLTAAGQKRAEELARISANPGLTDLYATRTQRSCETVWPLAQRLGLPVHYYDYGPVGAVAALVKQLRALPPGRTGLVVAHSDTVQSIATGLGGAPDSCMVGNDFDHLCVLTLPQPGATRVVHLHYATGGPPSVQPDPPPPECQQFFSANKVVNTH